MKNAVQYYLNLFNSIANKNAMVYFDFTTSGSGIVNNITGTSGYLNGNIINYNNSFWNKSGSGFLSNNYININTTGDIDLNYVTYSMVYEKVSPGGATLISTIDTGYDSVSGFYNKGYEFGVTANNKLYFEYYSQDGPSVLTSDYIVSDKSSVFLNLDNGMVSFGYYDFFRSKINSNIFSINNSYLFNTTGVNLGYNPAASGGYSYNKQFTGFIDQFFLFSPPIYTFDIISLNSGYANSYYSSTQNVTYIPITGVTGYSTGVTGFYTTITGYTTVATGVIYDDFGNQFSGFSTSPLTGTYYGTGIIPLTGVSLIPLTGVSTGDYTIYNSGYVAGFGKRTISILKKIDGSDFIEVSVPDHNYNPIYQNNLITKYDYVQNSFFNSYIKQNPSINFIVFVNGVAQNSGLYTASGTVYSPVNIQKNDYIVTDNNEISFNIPFDASNNVSVDMVSGVYNTGFYIENFYYNPSLSSISLPWPTNYNVFFNGQKLASGQDSQIGITAQYGVNSTGIYFKYINIFSGVSGQLFALPKNFNITSTGLGSHLITFGQTFYDNYSEVYMNGIRLSPDSDYLELPIIDSNAGSGIFDIKTGILYNNNQSF